MTDREKILVCGPNWVGDAVMAMPALQAFRRATPGAGITMLVKAGMAPLWRMHASVDHVETFDGNPSGTFHAGVNVRNAGYQRAYIFANSFRSALVPYLGGVPERIGAAGHSRRAMLTRVIEFKVSALRRHQTFEYFDILGLETAGFEVPRLTVPVEAVAMATEMLGASPGLRVGIVPGAARGPSKRWPAAGFGDVAFRLVKEHGARVALFGATEDRELCAGIVKRAGPGAENFAGCTTISEWAAALKLCDLVICNDSGGMHLAAAVGTPVLAIFGITDPARTGPLGTRRRIIQDSVTRSRDIARRSKAAEKSLVAIEPDRVYDAALECLDTFRRSSSAA